MYYVRRFVNILRSNENIGNNSMQFVYFIQSKQLYKYIIVATDINQ